MIETFIAFEGQRRLASGSLAEVALTVKRAGQGAGPVIIFSDGTGRAIDLDLRGSDDEIVGGWLQPPPQVRYRTRSQPSRASAAGQNPAWSPAKSRCCRATGSG